MTDRTRSHAGSKPGRVVTLTTNPTLDAIAEIPEGAFPIANDVLRVRFRYNVGGKGITCSRMLKNLGGETQAVVLLGDDGVVSCIEFYLRQQELNTAVVRAHGLGRICLILTEVEGESFEGLEQRPTTGTDYRINGTGFKVDERVLARVLDELRRSLAGAGALALAGSLPEGAPADFYAQCIHLAKGRVPLIALDSSGEPLRHGVKARPTLVKINAQEAAWLMQAPVPADIMQAVPLARSIAETYGIDRVIITLGAAGALALDGAVQWAVCPPMVKAQGALGAGDSFIAGLTYCLSKGGSFAEGLRWGAACGAATAEQRAGLIGSRARVLELLDRVELRELVPGEASIARREAAAAKAGLN